jgi:hypothetical protein
MEVFSNGTKLHARVEGPDGAPWLVLSHGVDMRFAGVQII